MSTSDQETPGSSAMESLMRKALSGDLQAIIDLQLPGHFEKVLEFALEEEREPKPGVTYLLDGVFPDLKKEDSEVTSEPTDIDVEPEPLGAVAQKLLRREPLFRQLLEQALVVKRAENRLRPHNAKLNKSERAQLEAKCSQYSSRVRAITNVPSVALEFLRWFQRGDPDANELIVHVAGPYLWACTVNILNHSSERAKDSYQTAWLKAYKWRDRFRGSGKFGGWLATIFRRQALDLVDSVESEAPASFEEPVGDRARSPEESIDIQDAIAWATSDFSSDRLRILELRVEGKAFAEIATAIGATPAKARSEWIKIQGLLRNRLESQGLDLPPEISEKNPGDDSSFPSPETQHTDGDSNEDNSDE